MESVNPISPLPHLLVNSPELSVFHFLFSSFYFLFSFFRVLLHLIQLLPLERLLDGAIHEQGGQPLRGLIQLISLAAN